MSDACSHGQAQSGLGSRMPCMIANNGIAACMSKNVTFCVPGAANASATASLDFLQLQVGAQQAWPVLPSAVPSNTLTASLCRSCIFT